MPRKLKDRKLKFYNLSNKTCLGEGCKKKLKQRLINQKEPHNILFCYTHHLVIRGRKAVPKQEESE